MTFTRTAPEIRERAGRIRRLTPLVAYDEIIAATRQPDDETATARREHTANDLAQHRHTVAAARNGAESNHDDDSV